MSHTRTCPWEWPWCHFKYVYVKYPEILAHASQNTQILKKRPSGEDRGFAHRWAKTRLFGNERLEPAPGLAGEAKKSTEKKAIDPENRPVVIELLSPWSTRSLSLMLSSRWCSFGNRNSSGNHYLGSKCPFSAAVVMENGGISYPLEQPSIATTSLDGSEDCDQSQPVLAGALQRWGERHKNKVSTLTASDISCLHHVELDGAPLVPDESVKKRLRPLPTQKQSKKMAAERRSRVAKGSMSTSSRESGDVIAGAGDKLEETKVCCEEIVDQERKRESACDGEVDVRVSGGRSVAGAQARRESREKRRRGVLGGLLKMNISESLAGLSRNMLVRRQTSADHGVIPTGTFVQGEGPFEGPLTTDMLKQVRACFPPTKRDCVRVHELF